MSVPRYDAVIIGGGFFGCSIAIALAQAGQKVLLCEQAADLLTAASYHNQARIHNGYHYPRSVLTALRSRVNFPHWVEAYRGCVVDDFEAYYAIAQRFSKVSARQFQAFMERVGAPLDPAPNAVQQWFNPSLIEQVYRVKESVFDAVKLRELMLQGLADARVEVRLQSRATKVQGAVGGGIECTLEEAEMLRQVIAGHVYNCTYSRINELLIGSQFPQIRLKHELTEMALVEVPERLRQVGITVMCGPFFSLMPFPARKLHTLSHVRYTPHAAWKSHGSRASRVGLRCCRLPIFVSCKVMHSVSCRCWRNAARWIPSGRSRRSCLPASKRTAVRSSLEEIAACRICTV